MEAGCGFYHFSLFVLSSHLPSIEKTIDPLPSPTYQIAIKISRPLELSLLYTHKFFFTLGDENKIEKNKKGGYVCTFTQTILELLGMPFPNKKLPLFSKQEKKPFSCSNFAVHLLPTNPF